jgi:hypothetical protein
MEIYNLTLNSECFWLNGAIADWIEGLLKNNSVKIKNAKLSCYTPWRLFYKQ